MLDADGTYCLDAEGVYGVDCEDPPMPRVSARAEGLYPAGVAGLALQMGRGAPSVLHGARLAVQGGVGSMPSVVAAEQVSARVYAALGLSLTIGLGAK
jgi:hypothetical protein